MAETKTCHKCGREDAADASWAIYFVNGLPQFATCPDCLTADDEAELSQHDKLSGRRQMTEARLFDTATLTRLNQEATHAGGPSFVDELIDGLDPEATHLAIRGGSFEIDGPRYLLMVVPNTEAADSRPILSSRTGEEIARVISPATGEDEAPRCGFLEIHQHEWMGGDHVLLEGVGWQDHATREASAFIARAGVS